MSELIAQTNMAVGYHRTNYRSYLIKQKLQNATSAYAREEVAKFDWLAHKLTYKVGETLTAEEIEGIPPGILVDWEEREYRALVRTVITKCLIHGYCLVELYDDAPFWDVYAGPDVVELNLDDSLMPLNARISVYVNKKSKQKTVHIDGKTVFLVEYMHQRDWMGLPILYSVWDSITYARLLTHNMCQYDARLGSGFPILTVDPQTVLPEDVAAVASGLDQLDSKAGIILPVGATFEMMGSDKQTDFVNHYRMLLEQVAGGTDFPLKWINGESKGAVLASKEDGDMIRSTITHIFGSFKRFVQKLIKVVWGLAADPYPNLVIAADTEEYEGMQNGKV